MKIALLLALSLCALRAAPSYAQLDSQPQAGPLRRQGLTVSVGAGAGSAHIDCEGCGNVRNVEPTGYLRIGYALRPSLILAWEINGWTRTRSDSGAVGSISIGTGTALAQWYPSPSRDFFLSSGVGVGGLSLAYTDPGKLDLSDESMAFGYQMGAGYDIRVRPNFSLTPFITYFASAGARFSGGGVKSDGNVLELGLGATWH